MKFDIFDGSHLNCFIDVSINETQAYLAAGCVRVCSIVYVDCTLTHALTQVYHSTPLDKFNNHINYCVNGV